MAGSPTYITLPPNSTGSNVQAWSNTISGTLVLTEAVTPTNSSGIEEGTSANPIRIDPVGTTTQPVFGTLTNNSAAPSTTNEGVLSAIANAANPSWTEGYQVLASVDLSGNQRVKVNSALPAGTNIIGKVGIDQTTVGTTNAISIAQIGATTVNTAASGTILVGVADGSGNALTSNSTATSGKHGLDVNVLSILGTAPTTAGFVDIKGADGNVFVRQTTASNLNATVVGAGTAGSPSGGVVSVQGVSSGTTLPVTATIAASQTIAVTQATASSLNATVSIASAQTLATVSTVTAVTSITNAVKVEGNAGGAFDAATNATPPANAIQIAGIAATALPSANSATDLTVPMTDKFGRLVVLPQAMRDLVAYTGTTITSSTSATNILTGISSVYTDICSLTITNSSGTATLVTLSDGTNSYIFSAGVGPGWGVTIPFSPPIPATSTNTNWTLQCGTSVASIYVVVGYVKNK